MQGLGESNTGEGKVRTGDKSSGVIVVKGEGGASLVMQGLGESNTGEVGDKYIVVSGVGGNDSKGRGGV